MKSIYYIEKEWCSREKKKLCCFHVHFFKYNVFGRKDGNWYMCLGNNTLWLFPNFKLN